jgi:asparagine synthase (glutamine-hydrolysing)
MCSIFAILGPGFDSSEIDSYRNASLKMKHRGPDHSGFASRDSYYLGHNRLSITGGADNNQPINSLRKTSQLVFNGQIYNCPELILKYDLKVNPENDSQVLIELIEKFGTKILSEVNGVFAGVFIDNVSKSAILFRDKVGARPLYYFQGEVSVIVASEIGPIFEFYGSKQVEEQSIVEVFALNFTVSKDTFYSGIHSVPPATSLSVNLESGQIDSSEKYFNYERLSSKKPTTEELKSALVASLKRQYPTNMKSVIYLSSGLDSSLITILSADLASDVSTVTVRFPDINVGESLEASNLASKLNVSWRPIDIDKQKFSNNLSSALFALQEPRIGQSCINYILHKEIAPNFKVAFSGAGADELFGGYPWRYPLRVESEQVVPVSKSLSETAIWIASRWCKVGNFEKAIACFDININFSVSDAIEIVRTELSGYEIDWNDPWAAVEACLAFERNYFLKNLLTVDDSLSMQFGLEIRVPFLDDEIIKLSQNFHPSQFFSYCHETKSILGKAPIRLLVSELGFPEIASRQKLGFSAPTDLVSSSLCEYIFNVESEPVYGLVRKRLESLVSTLEEREKQSLLWVIAEIKSLT